MKVLIKSLQATAVVAVLAFSPFANSFSQDSLMIRKIYTEALVNGQGYDNLRYLCKQIGPRLTGSRNAEKAVLWAKNLMESYDLDSVWLQPVQAPKWVRGDREEASIILGKRSVPVDVTSLGNTYGTGEKGITGEIIEITSLDQLAGEGDLVKGKIVFINQPMPLEMINTFDSYSEAGVIRFKGPRKAAKLGAIGVVVRSLNIAIDDYPHTGTTDYGKIPAVAISTEDAEFLSKTLSEEKDVQFYLKNTCRMEGEVPSYNVIGEIRGNEYPDEVIVVSGHLDSWDLAEGAHDDGAGVIHALEAVRILSENYEPRRTIRVVMFMNEENGLAGGKKYASVAKANNEKHIAAFESDRGGFLPHGFTIDANDETIEKIASWKMLFEPYNIFLFKKGYGGADINPLKKQNVPLLGLFCDSQRYFEYHHSGKDVFEAVNKRELELGCATLGAMVYLVDNYGL